MDAKIKDTIKSVAKILRKHGKVKVKKKNIKVIGKTNLKTKKSVFIGLDGCPGLICITGKEFPVQVNSQCFLFPRPIEAKTKGALEDAIVSIFNDPWVRFILQFR